MPKVRENYNSHTLALLAFHHCSSLLWKVQYTCLCVYLDRKRAINSLFSARVGHERISHGIVEAIILTYNCKVESPQRDRGLIPQQVWLTQLATKEICNAGCLATPHTLMKLYRLDVTASLLGHTVLSVGAPEEWCFWKTNLASERAYLRYGSWPYPICDTLRSI